MKEQKQKMKSTEFLGDILILVFGPILFLVIVPFTGYQIFYNTNGVVKKKSVILLSVGAALYLTALVIYSIKNSNF